VPLDAEPKLLTPSRLENETAGTERERIGTKRNESPAHTAKAQVEHRVRLPAAPQENMQFRAYGPAQCLTAVAGAGRRLRRRTAGGCCSRACGECHRRLSERFRAISTT